MPIHALALATLDLLLVSSAGAGAFLFLGKWARSK